MKVETSKSLPPWYHDLPPLFKNFINSGDHRIAQARCSYNCSTIAGIPCCAADTVWNNGRAIRVDVKELILLTWL
jgi:hypothetical protein